MPATLPRLAQRLVEPPRDPASDEERRRARLVLTLAAALAPVALFASTVVPWALSPAFSFRTNPGAVVGVLASLALFGTWVVGRLGHLRAAAWALVGIGILAAWAAAIVNRAIDGVTPLFYLAAVVLIGSLVLSSRATAWIAAGNVAGTLLLPFVVRDIPATAIITPLVFLGIVSTLIVVEAAIRHRGAQEAEAAALRLAESEERYRSLFEASFEGLSIDADGVVVDGNPRFGPLFGYADEDVNGRPLEAFVAEPSRAAVAGLRDGDTLELIALRKDGSTFPVEIVARACTYAGGPARVLAWRDLTSAKRAAAELDASRRRVMMSEKLSALGTLVAGVGHEINNPLAYMRGTVDLHRDLLAELLARGDLPADVRAQLADIHENEAIVLRGITRIDHITASLKKVARAGNGERQLEDVNALADSVLTVAAPRLKGGLTVERDFRATRPALANGSELSQVLLNLVFNAADAVAGRSGARIVLRSYDEASCVVVEVEDNGVGIAAEHQSRIFEPFHTTKPTGTGLGLSTSWRIVEDHGGRLSFETRPGVGTTFRIEIPAGFAISQAPRTPGRP